MSSRPRGTSHAMLFLLEADGGGSSSSKESSEKSSASSSSVRSGGQGSSPPHPEPSAPSPEPRRRTSRCRSMAPGSVRGGNHGGGNRACCSAPSYGRLPKRSWEFGGSCRWKGGLFVSVSQPNGRWCRVLGCTHTDNTEQPRKASSNGILNTGPLTESTDIA